MTAPTLLGISITAVVVIGGGVLVNASLNPPVSSFDSAMERLERRLLPSISVESAMPPASSASAEAPLPLAERLPQATAFPLYGAPADQIDHSGSSLRVEIVSSLEKADNQRASSRWLVDGAERFNQRRERGNDGRRIEVVVRPIPSGLAGQLRMGTCNPYLCSPGLDFMHTLLWTTAGHAGNGGALQVAELERGSIQRSLELFQQRVSRIDPTYIEQIEIWKRRPEALDAAVMAEQSYRQLRREPGFEDLLAVPFGADQGSPLVALPWTTGPERQALERFSRFMTSAPLQTLARSQDFGQPSPVPAKARPPRADGELLSRVQRLWKQRKDGGRTVYLQLLVDVSGSMNENNRLSQLKRALIVASGAINSGNQVGLISFSDKPTRLMPLQPYDASSRARLLATVQGLQANGTTALYDGLAVALHDLMQARRRDPNGRFHLLVLSDGMATRGLNLGDLRSVIENSEITITPIAYGDVNDGELRDIAAIRESAVYRGDPKLILPLINDLFQTAL